jgi:hypothetical protein
MPAVQLIPPVRQHQRNVRSPQHPGQERHQIPRRRIGPVQILQHDEGRPRLSQPDQEGHHVVEYGSLIRASRLAWQGQADVKTRPGQLRDLLCSQLIP